jgi:hypothetical protein
MIVNAWGMQNSTGSPVAIGAFANAVRELVGSYNDSIEQVVLRGWDFLRNGTRQPGYFDEPFYHYISDRFIDDRAGAATPSDYQAAVQDYLDTSPGTIKDSLPGTPRAGIAVSQCCYRFVHVGGNCCNLYKIIGELKCLP